MNYVSIKFQRLKVTYVVCCNVVRVNGHACLDPKKATTDHFFFEGLYKPGNTSNPLGTFINRSTVDKIPWLTTLDVSTVRVDYALHGIVPSHRHPRASKIFIALDGEVLVGFVTSDPENKLFSKG
ncbi:germin 2-1, partial [Olea europaea subsp. europaea]